MRSTTLRERHPIDCLCASQQSKLVIPEPPRRGFALWLAICFGFCGALALLVRVL